MSFVLLISLSQYSPSYRYISYRYIHPLEVVVSLDQTLLARDGSQYDGQATRLDHLLMELEEIVGVNLGRFAFPDHLEVLVEVVVEVRYFRVRQFGEDLLIGLVGVLLGQDGLDQVDVLRLRLLALGLDGGLLEGDLELRGDVLTGRSGHQLLLLVEIVQ